MQYIEDDTPRTDRPNIRFGYTAEMSGLPTVVPSAQKSLGKVVKKMTVRHQVPGHWTAGMGFCTKIAHVLRIVLSTRTASRYTLVSDGMTWG